MSINQKLLFYVNELEKNIEDTNSLEFIFDKLKDEMKDYQENPLLLRPHINLLIEPLINYMKNEQYINQIYIYKLLYVICNVIGYKSFISYLPHEIKFLVSTIKLLQNEEHDNLNWEKTYIVLLWLAIVCKNPFNFLLMNQQQSPEFQSVTGQIREICQKYLVKGTKSADAAAYLSGQYLSRPEIFGSELPNFLLWAQNMILNTSLDSMTNVHTLKSIMMALSYIFKNGDRDDMLPYAKDLLEFLIKREELSKCSHAIVKKTYLKLLQHVAVVTLDPTIALQRADKLRNRKRFKQDSSMLKDAIKRHDKDKAVQVALPESQKFASNLNGNSEMIVAGGDVVGSLPLPKVANEGSLFGLIQETVGLLVQGLRDKDTEIYHTSAKGISRIALHLPETYMDSIFDALLPLFSQLTAGDIGWQGGCIAVAELARKSLIPHKIFPRLMPYLVDALHFERRSGTTYIGSRVRDAACYAYWSMVRSYEPDLLEPYVPSISKDLLTIALFDMSDQCRRAASATFQEFVGRLIEDMTSQLKYYIFAKTYTPNMVNSGYINNSSATNTMGEEMIPFGIEVLTKVDFQAVSSLERCYGELAPYVATLGSSINGGGPDLPSKRADSGAVDNLQNGRLGIAEGLDYRFPSYYGPHIIEHLVRSRVGHWEPRIRNLAARALGLISAFGPPPPPSGSPDDVAAETGATPTVPGHVIRAEATEAVEQLARRLSAKLLLITRPSRDPFSCHGILTALGHVISGGRLGGCGIDWLHCGGDHMGSFIAIIRAQLECSASLYGRPATAPLIKRRLDYNERWRLAAVCGLISRVMSSDHSLASQIFSAHDFVHDLAKGDRAPISLIDITDYIVYPGITADHVFPPSLLTLTTNDTDDCLLQLSCQTLTDLCLFSTTTYETEAAPGISKNFAVGFVKNDLVKLFLEPLLKFYSSLISPDDSSIDASYTDYSFQISCCYALSSIPSQLLLGTELLNRTDGRDAGDLFSLLIAVGAANVGSSVDLRRAILDTLTRIVVSLMRAATVASQIAARHYLTRLIDRGLIPFGLYDYTRDSQRGDLGRTVRHSALLCVSHLLESVAMATTAGGGDGAVTMTTTTTVADEYGNNRSDPLSQDGWPRRLAVAVVRQACSKLQPLRVEACAVIRSLLTIQKGIDKDDNQLASSQSSPDATLWKRLLISVFDRDDINWASCAQSYIAILPLLNHVDYLCPVLSEMILSLGCLSDDTAKHSATAFREYLLTSSPSDIDRFCNALNYTIDAEITNGPECLTSEPVHVIIDHVTLLRAVEVVINLGLISYIPYARFYAKLLGNVNQLSKTPPKNMVNKILVTLKLYGTLLLVLSPDGTSEVPNVSSDIVSGASLDGDLSFPNLLEYKRAVVRNSTKYFVHKIPRIRKYAAEMLYEYCVVNGLEICPGPGDEDTVSSILSDTNWLIAEEARSKCDELKVILGLI